ncbi:YeaC family protein [Glaciecola sp. MF2-115]|uniref:YeaC family protein n=1 Tax=Glaciecola sp. MF2-115 TaxID=3384827 RepID=UPI00399F11C7
MDIQQLVKAMTPEVYENLRNAVETGKWPDGNALSEEQKSNSMQAVLMYQAQVEQSDQHMTIGKNGEVVQKSRQQLQQDFANALDKDSDKNDLDKDDLDRDNTQDAAVSSSPQDLNTIARFKQDDI